MNQDPPGDTSYYVLTFEPDESSSLHRTIERSAGTIGIIPHRSNVLRTDSPGTQLFIALLDSFGTSLGVLPDKYIVIRESAHVYLSSSSCDT